MQIAKGIDEMKKVKLVNCKQGGFGVYIDGVNFGIFDQIEKGGQMCYFPRRTERMSGDHYIAIGAALNDANKVKSNEES